jgi:superfamily II DNA helicase RecQ
VYSSSVEQTREVGEVLECPIYYYSVDDRARKARQMKELMEGKSRVITATNVLGLGVDLLDIRAVIYIGQLRKLRDYVQESKQARRDSKSSKAIIVYKEVENAQPS